MVLGCARGQLCESLQAVQWLSAAVFGWWLALLGCASDTDCAHQVPCGVCTAPSLAMDHPSVHLDVSQRLLKQHTHSNMVKGFLLPALSCPLRASVEAPCTAQVRALQPKSI